MKIIRPVGTHRTISQIDKRLAKMAGKTIKNDEKPTGFLARNNKTPTTGRNKAGPRGRKWS